MFQFVILCFNSTEAYFVGLMFPHWRWVVAHITISITCWNVDALPSNDFLYGFVRLSTVNQGFTSRSCVNVEEHTNVRLVNQSEESFAMKFKYDDNLRSVCDYNDSDIWSANYDGEEAGAVFLVPSTVSKCPLHLQLMFAYNRSAKAVLFVVPSDLPMRQHFYPSGLDYSKYPNIRLFFIELDRYHSLIKSLSPSKGDEIRATFTKPAPVQFAFSLIIIFFLAVSCYVVGGLWSGHVRHTLLLEHDRHSVESEQSRRSRHRKKKGNAVTSNSGAVQGGQQSDEELQGQNAASINDSGQAGPEPIATPFNIISIVFFVAFLVTVLLLLFYVYHVFVWIIIVLFTIGSSSATFACVKFFFDKIPGMDCRLPFSFADCARSLFRRSQSCFSDNVPLKISHILLYLSCAALSITWCVFRNEPFAWGLLDALGVMFCIHFIKNLRLPSLKWITILLVLLIIYDVVFVFISPFWTSNGCSIMVDIATGQGCSEAKARGVVDNPKGDSIATPYTPLENFTIQTIYHSWKPNITVALKSAFGGVNSTVLHELPVDGEKWTTYMPRDAKEKIPVVFKVPTLGTPTMPCFDWKDEASEMFSVLGFGDVILPGFLVAYCMAFDLAWKTPWKCYYLTCSLAYIVGMIITFVSLQLTKAAQPALVYLVPATLLPIHILALIRGEWRKMWHGQFTDVGASGPERNPQEAPAAELHEITSAKDLPEESSRLMHETEETVRANGHSHAQGVELRSFTTVT